MSSMNRLVLEQRLGDFWRTFFHGSVHASGGASQIREGLSSSDRRPLQQKWSPWWLLLFRLLPPSAASKWNCFQREGSKGQRCDGAPGRLTPEHSGAAIVPTIVSKLPFFDTARQVVVGGRHYTIYARQIALRVSVGPKGRSLSPLTPCPQRANLDVRLSFSAVHQKEPDHGYGTVLEEPAGGSA